MDLHTSDDRKIIMVNSYVASAGTNISGSGVGFHKIPRYKERQNVWLITLRLAKPSNLKHTSVCSDHFLEDAHYSNYESLSELLGRNAKEKLEQIYFTECVFLHLKNQEK